MSKKAVELFWWPYTQRKLAREENVTVINSGCGESFLVHKVRMLYRLNSRAFCLYSGTKYFFCSNTMSVLYFFLLGFTVSFYNIS